MKNIANIGLSAENKLEKRMKSLTGFIFKNNLFSLKPFLKNCSYSTIVVKSTQRMDKQHEGPCNCSDEEHKKHPGHENDKHVGNECIHPDGTRHQIHTKA